MNSEQDIRMQEADLVDEMFSMIEGYQKSILFFSAMESTKARNFLLDYFGLIAPDLSRQKRARLLNGFSQWAKYHKHEMKEIWKNLSVCLEEGRPVCEDSHARIPLGLYSHGMGLRNRGMENLWNTKLLGPHVKGKIILDIGGGCGYWAQFLKWSLHATFVTIVERKEIVDQDMIFLPEKARGFKVIPKDFIEVEEEDLKDHFPEVFFLSEVLHGKSEGSNILLLKKISSLFPLHSQLKIIINELFPPHNLLFSLQMKLHTYDGKPYRPHAILNMIEGVFKVKNAEGAHNGPRHYLQVFEVETVEEEK